MRISGRALGIAMDLRTQRTPLAQLGGPPRHFI
jgi:hypothetical protein